MIKLIIKFVKICSPIISVCLLLFSIPIGIILAHRADCKKAKSICDSFPDKQYVDAIFFHESNCYTIFIKHDKELFEKRLCSTGYVYQTSKLINDVKPVDKSFVKYITNLDGSKCTVEIQLHIPGADYINGGGWNHGKFGSGQTSRIFP